jgi:GT2 family glycosyltransferase
VFAPDVTITHLGGQSTKDRFPIAFELDKHRNRYRYFYKYFGEIGVCQCRLSSLACIRIRHAGYRLLSIMRPSDRLQRRLELYRAAAEWNWTINPVQFVKRGTEPEQGMQPTLRVPQ